MAPTRTRLPLWAAPAPLDPRTAARRAASFEDATEGRSARVEVDVARRTFRMELRPEGGQTPLSWLPRVIVDPPATTTKVSVGPRGRVLRTPALDIPSFSPFSVTTKMAAPSFSLPAGPPGRGGGSCPSSTLRAAPGQAFICHVCYALQGNFRYADQVGLRAARLAWVRQRLRRPGAFAAEMIAALTETLERRPVWQLGMWNPAYFRIHDSGDFLGSAAYVREWATIARAFSAPGRRTDGTPRAPVTFWAPTREWVYFPEVVEQGLPAQGVPPTRSLGARPLPDLERAMRAEALGGECPPNLVIRPSALGVGDPPPRVHGLAAGSTVLPEALHAALPRCGFDADEGVGHCHCPSDERRQPWTQSGNCEDAGCRNCWLKPEVSVDYKEK